MFHIDGNLTPGMKPVSEAMNVQVHIIPCVLHEQGSFPEGEVASAVACMNQIFVDTIAIPAIKRWERAMANAGESCDDHASYVCPEITAQVSNSATSRRLHSRQSTPRTTEKTLLPSFHRPPQLPAPYKLFLDSRTTSSWARLVVNCHRSPRRLILHHAMSPSRTLTMLQLEAVTRQMGQL